MKRKLLMMSFAMMAGLPHSVFAKDAQRDVVQAYPSWNGAYVPHYGSEGLAHPLMNHLDAHSSSARGEELNQWRLGFEQPQENLMGAQEPVRGKGAQAGVSLKLDF